MEILYQEIFLDNLPTFWLMSLNRKIPLGSMYNETISCEPAFSLVQCEQTLKGKFTSKSASHCVW